MVTINQDLERAARTVLTRTITMCSDTGKVNVAKSILASEVLFIEFCKVLEVKKRKRQNLAK